MTKSRNAMLLTIVMVWIFVAAVATAQVHTGSIAGVVRDKAGAVVPNATVTAKNSETGAERTVQSNAEGSYNILALPPGNYDVTVTSGNFAPFTQKAAVSVGGTATVDATLGVSGRRNVGGGYCRICRRGSQHPDAGTIANHHSGAGG